MRRAALVVGVLAAVTACTTADTGLPPQIPGATTSVSGSPTAKSTAPAQPKAVRDPAGAALISASYGPIAQSSTLTKYLRFLVTDVNAMWAKTFAAAGASWLTVGARVVGAGRVRPSACQYDDGSPAPAGDPDEFPDANPAFYCPVDGTVYLSTPWLLHNVWYMHIGQTRLGGPVLRRGGDLGIALVVAHEIGHAVQQQQKIGAPAGSTTVRPLELQADCFAGVWAYAKFSSGQLDTRRIRSALESAEDVGDLTSTNPDHHGTPEERVNAFHAGYVSGNPGACPLDVGAADPADQTGGGE
jgi:uncharacterized protein